MDLESGYWQIEIHTDDRETAAFITEQGLWKFKVKPFGLCTALKTFNYMMETALRGISCEACLVYLDGIITAGRAFEEHLRNI